VKQTIYTEIKRKSIHLTGSLIPIFYHLTDRNLTLGLLALVLFVGGVLEALRLRGMIWLPLLREHEKSTVGGHVYFILGSLLTVLLYPENAAITAILMLAFGDTASGILGAKILKNRNNKNNGILTISIKPKIIFTTTLLASLGAGLLATPFLDLKTHTILIGAMGASLADGIHLQIGKQKIDDNLTIPLTAGGFMSISDLF